MKPRILEFEKMIQRVADRFGTQAATAWTKAVLGQQARINAAALESAIASGSLAQIESVIGPANLQKAVSSAIYPSVLGAMQVMGQQATQALVAHGVAATFNTVHPNVVLAARRQAADLVVDIPAQTKQVIAEVVARGAERGLTTKEQARAIREVVGLPPNWAQAPDNLAVELQRGQIAAATDRRLSAATKQQIRSRAAAGTLDDAFIQKVSAEYAASLINRRALNIARTETLRAGNAGLNESWKQAADQGVLPSETRRFWIVTPDDRLSEEHAEIPAMNADGRRLDEPFDTPSGAFMYPPIRPNCRCSVGLGFTGTSVPSEAAAVDQAISDLPVLSEDALANLEDVGVPIDPTLIYRENPFATPTFLADDTGMAMGALDPFLDEHLTAAQYARMTELWNKPENLPLRKVSLKDLQSTQPFVVDKPLREIASGAVRTPDEAARAAIGAGASSETPFVVRVNGQNIIVDGNHRLTVDLLKGDETAKVHFLDIDSLSGGRTVLTQRVGGVAVAAGPLPEVEAAIQKTLTDLGVNPDVLTYKDLGKAKGSIKGYVAGEYRDGRIFLTPNQSTSFLKQTVAHEATHLQFDVAIRTDKQLKKEILADWKGLSRDDGVTAYSRAHWAKSELWEGMDLGARPEWMRMIPVNETLAEIRAMQAAGRTVGSPRYRALLKRVEKAYEKGASKKLRPLPGMKGGALKKIETYDERQLRRAAERKAAAIASWKVTPDSAKVWTTLSAKEKKALIDGGIRFTEIGGIQSLGLFDPANREVYLRIERGAWSAKDIVTHEIGHALDFLEGTSHGGEFWSDSTASKKLWDAYRAEGVAGPEMALQRSTYRELLKESYNGNAAADLSGTAAYRREFVADLFAASKGATVRNMWTAQEFKAMWPESFAQFMKESKGMLKQVSLVTRG